MPGDDERLRAEARYIAGGISLPALAKELGVSRSTVERWSARYKWREKKARTQARASKKAESRISNRIARQLERIASASDTVERAAVMAAQALEDVMADGPRELTVNQIETLGKIANAVGKLAETRMLISGMVSAAEREKLKLLRERLELEKANAAKGQPGSVRIELDGTLEELAE